MDTSVTIRSMPGVADAAYARSTPAPVQDAVATVLSPTNSVTAVMPTSNARNDAFSGTDPSLTRQFVIDQQTREVIFRVMDSRTRQVIRQVPDEALLRMRAYARAMAEGKNPSSVDFQTDLEA